MKRTRTYLALALAAVVTAPAAQASIPHEGGDLTAASDAALAARSERLNEIYGLGTGSGPTLPTRTAPPIVRLDGLAPVGATGSAAAGRREGTVQAQVAPRSIVTASGDGFDWTAAGIGFGTAAGLALVGAGSLVTARWRRHHGRPVAH